MKSLQFFEPVLEATEANGKKSLDAILGKAKILEKAKQYEAATEILSEACVCYPNFKPAFIEKAKIHCLNNEWDLAIDLVLQVLQSDKMNVEALRIYVFLSMTRDGDWEVVEEKMSDLLNSMKQIENKNADLFYNISRLFSRYCGRKEFMLTKTI
jgi:tetratricopeptide (TPR) repeat protein